MCLPSKQEMTCKAEEHTSSQVPDNVFKHIYFVWHLIDLVLNEKKNTLMCSAIQVFEGFSLNYVLTVFSLLKKQLLFYCVTIKCINFNFFLKSLLLTSFFVKIRNLLSPSMQLAIDNKNARETLEVIVNQPDQQFIT